RGNSNGMVGRCQRDHEDRSTHQREAEQHRGPASDAIGIDAKHEAADRPRDKACPESRKRQHQAAVLALRREEGMADLDREEAVGDEVIKLEHVADGRGKGGARHSDRLRACNVLGQFMSSTKVELAEPNSLLQSMSSTDEPTLSPKS